MEEEESPIFIVNPIEQAELLFKNVKITLTNSEILEGAVFTIDPVSESLVLMFLDDNETINIKILMKHSIQCIEKISDLDLNQKVNFEGLFTTEKSNSSYSKQKEKVKFWLEKNMIPVIESESVLKVGSLEIHAPYGPDQCFGGNAIVLSRVQNLLSQMQLENI